MKKYLFKRISAAALAAMLVLFSCVCVFAESSKKLIDDAGLFGEGDSGKLVTALEDTSSQTGWDVIIYTNNNGYDIDGDLAYQSDKYYNDNGFGKGADADGVMLVIDMGSRCSYILTKGGAKAYFSDSRITEINNDVLGQLGNGDNLNAGIVFANDVKTAYNDGVPGDGGYSNVTTEPERPEKAPYNFIAPIIGLIVGIIAAIIFAVSVNSRYKFNGKYGTYDLRKNSSMNLVDRQDVFVDRKVTYTTDPPPQSSSGSSGGSSSGGSSHGGGGGRF